MLEAGIILQSALTLACRQALIAPQPVAGMPLRMGTILNPQRSHSEVVALRQAGRHRRKNSHERQHNRRHPS